MTVSLLQVSNLRVEYRPGGMLSRTKPPKVAVDDVSFAVGAGETLGIVGESGSGKSTIGRAILRLAPITSGAILFDGKDISTFGRNTPLSYRRDVQAVFQDPTTSMNPRKRVADIIGAPIKRHFGLSGDKLAHAVKEQLDQVGLARHFLNRYPWELSGGQRQRVSIARALAVQPKFLVCDEPVSAVDVSTRGQIVNLLCDLQRELQLGYIFIGHDLGVVHHISDHIAVMSRGTMVEFGSADDIYFNAQHSYTRSLLEAQPQPSPEQQRIKRANRLARQANTSTLSAALQA